MVYFIIIIATLFSVRSTEKKKTMGDCSFKNATPILWNSFPLSLRKTGTIDKLRDHSKKDDDRA